MKPVKFQSRTTPTLVIEVVNEDGSPEDLSGATRKNIIVRRPDGSEFMRALGLYTDGVDGKLDITFTRDELRPTKVAVDYYYQVDLKFGDWDGPLPQCQFSVSPNLSSLVETA